MSPTPVMATAVVVAAEPHPLRDRSVIARSLGEPEVFAEIFDCYRPVPGNDPTAADRARTALLDHIALAEGPVIDLAGGTTTRRRTRRRIGSRRSRRALVGAAVAAMVAVVGITVTGNPLVETPPASADPLVELAHDINAAPQPSGDATLVTRHNAYPDGTSLDAVDLYTDAGRYFYAPSRTELPAVYQSGNESDGTTGLVQEAAAAAAEGPIDEARSRMLAAELPSSGPTEPPADQVERRQQAAPAATTLPPSDPATLDDATIWGRSFDALTSAGGRSDVRAGALRLLSSIDAVQVSPGQDGDRPVLDIRARLWSDGYEEHLVVDADTGIPLRATGGYPDATPTVLTTYTVERIDTSTLD